MRVDAGVRVKERRAFVFVGEVGGWRLQQVLALANTQQHPPCVRGVELPMRIFFIFER